YFKLRDLQLHQLLTFDFSQFCTFLTNNQQVISATYYVGAVRTDGTVKTQQLYQNQRKLLSHLRKHHFRYSLGYLLKSDGKFHEKGVDVNIAVDMLIAAYENQCDTIYLVSSVFTGRFIAKAAWEEVREPRRQRISWTEPM